MAFGRSTGLMSMLLYGFTPFMREQAQYLWQPYVSQFFVFLSVYFFFRFANEHISRLLLISFGFVALAVVLHTGAAGIVPVYSVAAWSMLRKNKHAKAKLLFLFLAGGAVVLASYLPTFFVPQHTPLAWNPSFPSFPAWVVRANMVYKAFGSAYTAQHGLAAAGMALSVFYLAKQGILPARKRFFAFLFACVTFQLLCLFILPVFYPVYLFPVVGFFPIMIAETGANNFYKHNCAQNSHYGSPVLFFGWMGVGR